MEDDGHDEGDRVALEAARTYLVQRERTEAREQGRPPSRGAVLAGDIRRAGPYRWVRAQLVEPVTRFELAANARTGEVLSWWCADAMDDDGDELTEEQCMEQARAAAQVPSGAVQGRCGLERLGDHRIYIARWHHEHEGLRVDGDQVIVQVNAAGGRIISVHRRWHDVDERPRLR